MQDKKSIYSLNKADGDAIVYTDANGKTIRLTRQNFDTGEEFEKWKAWSDEDFHTEEKGSHVYRNHTLRLSGLPEAVLSNATEQEKAEQRRLRRHGAGVRSRRSGGFFRRENGGSRFPLLLSGTDII